MKRKNLAKWMVVLVALVAVSTSMIAGTLAKYTSTFHGQDTALIAKWDIDVMDMSPEEEAIVTLELFKHSYNKNVVNQDDGEYIIAPGVDGNFLVEVVNNGDVAAKVTFKISIDTTLPNNADPLEFLLVDTENLDPEDFDLPNEGWVGMSDLADKLNATGSIFSEVKEGGNTKKAYVFWRWPFFVNESTDIEDTLLGKNSAEQTEGRLKYELLIEATAEQLPPDKN